METKEEEKVAPIAPLTQAEKEKTHLANHIGSFTGHIENTRDPGITQNNDFIYLVSDELINAINDYAKYIMSDITTKLGQILSLSEIKLAPANLYLDLKYFIEGFDQDILKKIETTLGREVTISHIHDAYIYIFEHAHIGAFEENGMLKDIGKPVSKETIDQLRFGQLDKSIEYERAADFELTASKVYHENVNLNQLAIEIIKRAIQNNHKFYLIENFLATLANDNYKLEIMKTYCFLKETLKGELNDKEKKLLERSQKASENYETEYNARIEKIKTEYMLEIVTQRHNREVNAKIKLEEALKKVQQEYNAKHVTKSLQETHAAKNTSIEK